MFGDEPNDRNFCCDGLVWPDRTPKPAMSEHRQLAAPVTVTRDDDGTLTLHNRMWFTDLAGVTASFEIADDDRVLASGSLRAAGVAPRSSAPRHATARSASPRTASGG